MFEEQRIDFTGCGNGPEDVIREQNEILTESIIMESKSEAELLYTYANREEGPCQFSLEIELEFDEDDEQLFW